jgi:hypothetical protein
MALRNEIRGVPLPVQRLMFGRWVMDDFLLDENIYTFTDRRTSALLTSIVGTSNVDFTRKTCWFQC